MYLSEYSVYMEYHKRQPGEPEKEQGKLNDLQFDFEYIQTKYLEEISKYTAASRHNCCF